MPGANDHPEYRRDSGGLRVAINATNPLGSRAVFSPGAVRRFQLTILDGPDDSHTFESKSDRCSIGFHPMNDLVINDASISRFHCELRIDGEAVLVRDLDSRNGTIVDGVAVLEAFLRDGSLLKLGKTTLRFDLRSQKNRIRVSERSEFGALVGTSVRCARASR